MILVQVQFITCIKPLPGWWQKPGILTLAKCREIEIFLKTSEYIYSILHDLNVLGFLALTGKLAHVYIRPETLPWYQKSYLRVAYFLHWKMQVLFILMEDYLKLPWLLLKRCLLFFISYKINT
jgi:hypothetical protein